MTCRADGSSSSSQLSSVPASWIPSGTRTAGEDYAPLVTRLVFAPNEAEALVTIEIIDDEEYELYEQVYARLAIDAPVPDLVVYLQAPVDVLLERIGRRGIPAEQLIERRYLEQLNEAYSQFFHFYDEAPLLIVNAAGLCVTYGWPEIAEPEAPPALDMDAISKAAAMINAARRPVLYAGGGVTNSSSHDTLRALASKNSIPVALTLMGLGCFPPDDPLYLGMLGMHAAPYTNLLLDEADLLIAVGARFDDRAVGRVQEFCPEAAIVHIDIDRAELDKTRKAHVSIACDAGEALSALLPLVGRDERPDWRARLSRIRDEHPFPSLHTDDALHPLGDVEDVAVAARADSDALLVDGHPH